MKDLNDPRLSEEILQRHRDHGAAPQKVLDIYLGLWSDLAEAARTITAAHDDLTRIVSAGRTPVHMITETHMRTLLSTDWGRYAATVGALHTTTNTVRVANAIEEALERLGLEGVDAEQATGKEAQNVAVVVAEILQRDGVRVDAHTLSMLLESANRRKPSDD